MRLVFLSNDTFRDLRGIVVAMVVDLRYSVNRCEVLLSPRADECFGWRTGAATGD